LIETVSQLIIHDNKHCQYITNNIVIFNKLKRHLSYKAVGVEYTAAYKNGWSGITYLMDKHGYFLLGLLSNVKEFLAENKDYPTITDNRKKVITNESIDLTEKLKNINITPRDYQEKIVEVSLNNSKGIVRACTGSGKTICTAMITAKVNKPTIIYVIGLDLLQQFHDLFSSLFDEEIGFIGNGICNVRRINIASIWTVGRSLKLNPKGIVDEEDDLVEKEPSQEQAAQVVNMLKISKLHIFDESHVITTDTIKHILNTIDPEHILGFSGTPYRDDGTDMLITGILGEKIIDVSASLLIKSGVLAQPIIKFISVPPIHMQMAQYQTVYKAYIVDNEARNNLIIQQAEELLEKKYTPLILFKQIKHGALLFEMMKERGIKCEILDGNDSLERRTEVKKMLENKEISLILASTIFDIGVDLPVLNALILAGGGKSSIRTLQRIGRVIRSYPGKKVAAIVDFYDQVKFLKKHAELRYGIYKNENGFKIFKTKEMYKLDRHAE